MSVLPGEVSQELDQLVGSLMSSDNNVRSSAEKTLEKEWQQSPEQVSMLLTFLAERACDAPDTTYQAFAAVMFRRVAIKTPEYSSSVADRTISSVPEPVRTQIRRILLQGFVKENLPKSVRHKLADAIAEMSKPDASPAGSWAELVPSILYATELPDPSFRESALRIIAAAPEVVEDAAEKVVQVFKQAFEDNDDEVRIAACSAFVAFFRGLRKSEWPLLQTLLPGLLNSLPRFLEAHHDVALAQVFESLIELVELAPKMFRDMFGTIVDFCATVCKDRDLDESCRMASLELLTTFAECAPQMCKREERYPDTFVVTCLTMLTEVGEDDDDAAEWNNSDGNDDDSDEDPIYDAARQALDRVALRLGGQTLAAPLVRYLPEMAQSSEWRQRQAALMALSSAAEGCVDVLMDQIDSLLDMVIPLVADPHPRVQYAGCNALGQMSTDFANVVQLSFGHRILPPLISHLTNKSVPRVQAHAAAALVNFSEAAPKEVLEPYLDQVLSNLLGLLQNSPKRYVQEQVLTTIAIIADAAQNFFSKYYDTLMPLLLHELAQPDTDEQTRSLKAKCIECSTLIALAVGREQFSAHAQEVLERFAALQQSIVSDDDPIKQFLEQGWCRVCRIVGREFLQVLPEILPPVLEQARYTQDVSLLEEDQAEEYTQNDDWDVINLSGKLIAVHTSTLDDKVTALDLLRSYAAQLKGDFVAYVDEIVEQIAIPALQFYLHDGVRASAALALASMMRSAVAADHNVAQLWHLIIVKLAQTMTSEPMPELLMAYYTAVIDMVNVVPASIVSGDPRLLRALATAINGNLLAVYERIKSRENGDDDDDYTEDVADSDDEYTDDELLDECNKLVSALFRRATPFAGQFLDVARTTVTTFVNDDNTHLKLCGLVMVCDVIDAGDRTVDLEPWLMVVAQSVMSAHAGVRQAASYAVGAAADHGIAPDFCIACLQPLFKMASVPDSGADENVVATETAVAAIGKIFHAYHDKVPQLDTALQQWVGLLPVIHDREQARFCYQFLVSLISSQHPSVTTQVPKVVESVVSALAHGTLSEEVQAEVIPAVRGLLSSLPQEQATALLAKAPEEVRKCIGYS
ncbi:hypothetical protein DIURU_003228 [Diutina rugosa]|uniref:TOG domain-containing protein n=1 Tax=Diutina rugosa TaxID=5481 RepID=A0A642ULX2_DIURU|nr:uncharacterized protein DIURU_003228 [Diutina rugosa]KAA8901519.1 hypothetical protein DIURU_003228 [Diutina rugosa]